MQPDPHTAQVSSYRPLSELVPSHWQSGTIDADDGARLHYTRTGGAKPAVILLHGFACAGLMWLRTALALEADYDVIMPDARGHGLSARVTGKPPEQQPIRDTAALIEALRLEHPALIGHSMGAETAGQLAAAQPDRVRALVLVDPVFIPFPPREVPEGDMPPGLDGLIQTMDSLQTQSHPERLLTMVKILAPLTNPSLWQEDDYASAIDAVIQFDANTFRYSDGSVLVAMPEAIARIASPILLLSSRDVPGVDRTSGIRVYEANWRAGRHVNFPDSGHNIPQEGFDRFIEVVREFLRHPTP